MLHKKYRCAVTVEGLVSVYEYMFRTTANIVKRDSSGNALNFCYVYEYMLPKTANIVNRISSTHVEEKIVFGNAFKFCNVYEDMTIGIHIAERLSKGMQNALKAGVRGVLTFFNRRDTRYDLNTYPRILLIHNRSHGKAFLDSNEERKQNSSSKSDKTTMLRKVEELKQNQGSSGITALNNNKK